MSTTITPSSFIQKWRDINLTERAVLTACGWTDLAPTLVDDYVWVVDQSNLHARRSPLGAVAGIESGQG